MKIINLALIVLTLPLWMSTAYSEASVGEAPRNIQITVEFRQASFQNQNGFESTSRSSQTQFIVVSEGLEGKIFIGEKLPYVAYYQNFLTREGYLASQQVAVELLDVGTSLVVRARLVGGGNIEVTLTPEVSYETSSGRRSIFIQKMSTSVVVPQGQPVDIGGSAAQSEFERYFYRSQSGQALRIILTPKVLD